jgi:hypothetical protein
MTERADEARPAPHLADAVQADAPREVAEGARSWRPGVGGTIQLLTPDSLDAGRTCNLEDGTCD